MDTNVVATNEAPEAEPKAKFNLVFWLDSITNVCVYLAVVLVPLFFLPFTLDVLELNKQTLLVVLTGIALLAWIGKALAEKRVVFSRSWVHLVVLVYLVGYLVVSCLSPDKYLSLVGNYGQMSWAFASIFAFVLFYFIVVNNFKSTTKLYHLVLAFLASSLAVGVLGFLQLVKVYPVWFFGEFTRAATFNTVGTINSLGIYLTVPIVLAAALTILGCKDHTCILNQKTHLSKLAHVVIWAMLVVGLLNALVIDYWVIWAAILFGTGLIVAISLLRTRNVDHPIKIVVPTLLVIISVLLLLFRTPLNLNLPSEVSPSMRTSWNIAKQTLQGSPLFGSGPGTWIYDYAQFRPAAVNLSQFWTVRFERSLSQFLTALATLGLIGMAFWLLLVISAVAKSAHFLIAEKNDDVWQAYLTVFSGWAVLVFIGCFYNYNVTHHFAFWFLLALLASLIAKNKITLDAKKSVVISAVLSLVFIFLCAAGISILWLSGQRMAADMKYAQAVDAFRAGQPIQQSIDALNSSVGLNRWNDIYFRNLSQAHLVQASQSIGQAATPESAALVNNAITNAVNSAKRATEVTPTNVDNWANFALVLQSITSFTRGADEQAITLYQEALKREPTNPVYYSEMGKIYILRADAYKQLLQASDEKVRLDTEQKIKIELDKAAEVLNQSILMKPDFAAAHYNLGLVYERQGKVADAIVKLEQVLQTDTQNVGVGFQLSVLYYRNNEKDKALNILEQILAIQPDYSDARWYLSALYEEKGEYDKAIAQVSKVAEMNPDDTAVKSRLDNLIQLRDKKSAPAPVPMLEPLSQEIQGPNEQNQVRQ